MGLLGALTFCGGVLPASAGAEKCVDCGGEEPGEELEAQILTIQIQGPGSVATTTKTVCENADSGSESCEIEVAEGKKVTLSATPGAGVSFLGWSGAGCSGTGSCEVTMTEPKSVTATFGDNTPPPVPTITSPTHEQVIESTSGGDVNVSFFSSGATSFICHVDSVLAASCSSPGWNTGDLSTGKHTVSVRAKDAAGNISDAATRSFKVVNLPETTLEGTPADGTVASSGHTAFTFSSSTGTSYRCTLNGTEIPCASDLDLSAEGTYTLTVAAGISPFGDSVVYYDKTPATRTWTVDFPALGAGGSGTDSSQATPLPLPLETGRVEAKLIGKWRLSGDQTIFRKLLLKKIPVGGKVLATCTGKDCPFRRKRPRIVAGVASLTSSFAGQSLDPGTKIFLRVNVPGLRSQTIAIETRARKAPRAISPLALGLS